ncbi:beta-N-acetylhexosaminidase [bacterium]|nr:beta-N-acetylhexosaminidase [bacterium]
MDLKQKIAQMFITGYQGFDFTVCPEFVSLLKQGLGGVIFFTQNIKNKEQFKSEIRKMKELSSVPLFFSIDQEGGRVERTRNIHGGAKYLSAKFAREKGEEFLREQTSQMLKELEDYGINMNFAPVLDVNTEPENPIIGERAYSDNTEEVIKSAQIVLSEYKKHKIIPVGKHFPGHGAAKKDSHLTLPEIDIPFSELKEKHIKPFKSAIDMGLSAIMVAHVFYPAIEKDKIPASLSEKVIQNLLRKELKFNGVVISDDMVMGGVKAYTPFEACKKGIEAGVNMFIYRNTDKNILDLTEEIETAIRNKEIDEKLIDFSVEKILSLKREII